MIFFYCENCSLVMNLVKEKQKVDMEMFKCKRCSKTKSIKWGTLFYDMRFSLYELLQLIDCFLKMSIAQAYIQSPK
jgi:transposase-like protein